MLLVPQGPCTPEELGNCSSIAVEDIGDTRVTVFRQDDSDAQISTVLLRGGTKNGLDDLQRSIGTWPVPAPPRLLTSLLSRRKLCQLC